MNKITIIGRITKDIQVTTTNSGVDFARFNVAVKGKTRDAQGNLNTDFFNCIAWKEKAKIIEKYCKKGDNIALIGAMTSRSYDKDGARQTFWELTVEDVEFLGGGKEQKSEPSLIEIDDDGLPF